MCRKTEESAEIAGMDHNVLGGFLDVRPAVFAAGKGQATFRNFRYGLRSRVRHGKRKAVKPSLQPLAPAHHARRIKRHLMLKKLNAAEVFPVRVFNPSGN
jgi:hypothetical protein